MATATPPNRPGQGRVTAQGQGAPPTGPQDVTRRLDGLRGWLAEIDRSLRRRSVLALVLTALAIGAGAAAIYISLTKNAESDRIDALETRIENLEAAAAGTATAEETLPGDQSDTGTEVVPETTSPETDGLGSEGAPDAGVGDDGASGGALP